MLKLETQLKGKKIRFFLQTPGDSNLERQRKKIKTTHWAKCEIPENPPRGMHAERQTNLTCSVVGVRIKQGQDQSCKQEDKKCKKWWRKIFLKMFNIERKRVRLWQRLLKRLRTQQKVHETLVQKILKNAMVKSRHIAKRNKKRRDRGDFKSVISTARARKGDLRSKLSKSIMRLLGHRSVSHGPEMMIQLKHLRGDIEKKHINELRCLYCGRKAFEIDHYKSAVRHGKMNIYLDMPIGLVPSCLTCHRAGKDNRGSPESVLEWFFKKPTGNKNRNHPQLVMERMITNNEYTEEYIMRVTERLVRFDEFHARHAPVLSPDDHRRISARLENILDKRFDDIQRDLEEWSLSERMFI